MARGAATPGLPGGVSGRRLSFTFALALFEAGLIYSFPARLYRASQKRMGSRNDIRASGASSVAPIAALMLSDWRLLKA